MTKEAERLESKVDTNRYSVFFLGAGGLVQPTVRRLVTDPRYKNLGSITLHRRNEQALAESLTTVGGGEDHSGRPKPKSLRMRLQERSHEVHDITEAGVINKILRPSSEAPDVIVLSTRHPRVAELKRLGKRPNREETASYEMESLAPYIPYIEGFKGTIVTANNPTDLLAQILCAETGVRASQVVGFNEPDSSTLRYLLFKEGKIFDSADYRRLLEGERFSDLSAREKQKMLEKLESTTGLGLEKYFPDATTDDKRLFNCVPALMYGPHAKVGLVPDISKLSAEMRAHIELRLGEDDPDKLMELLGKEVGEVRAMYSRILRTSSHDLPLGFAEFIDIIGSVAATGRDRTAKDGDKLVHGHNVFSRIHPTGSVLRVTDDDNPNMFYGQPLEITFSRNLTEDGNTGVIVKASPDYKPADFVEKKVNAEYAKLRDNPKKRAFPTQILTNLEEGAARKSTTWKTEIQPEQYTSVDFDTVQESEGATYNRLLVSHGQQRSNVGQSVCVLDSSPESEMQEITDVLKGKSITWMGMEDLPVNDDHKRHLIYVNNNRDIHIKAKDVAWEIVLQPRRNIESASVLDDILLANHGAGITAFYLGKNRAEWGEPESYVYIALPEGNTLEQLSKQRDTFYAIANNSSVRAIKAQHNETGGVTLQAQEVLTVPEGNITSYDVLANGAVIAATDTGEIYVRTARGHHRKITTHSDQKGEKPSLENLRAGLCNGRTAVVFSTTYSGGNRAFYMEIEEVAEAVNLDRVVEGKEADGLKQLDTGDLPVRHLQFDSQKECVYLALVQEYRKRGASHRSSNIFAWELDKDNDDYVTPLIALFEESKIIEMKLTR